MSDAYKLMGVAEGSIRGKSDLEKVRQRSKELYKKYVSEKQEKQAKRILEAFEVIKSRFRKQEGSSKAASNGSSGAHKTSNGAATASTASATASARPAAPSGGGSQKPNAQAVLAKGNEIERALAKLGGLPGTHIRQPDKSVVKSSSQVVRTKSSSDAAGGTSTAIRKPGSGLFSLTAIKPAVKRPSSQDIPFDSKRQCAVVAAKPPQNGAPEKQARLICKCTASYSALRFQGATGTFVCPCCRVRAMDPLNVLHKGSKGLLTMKLVQKPLIPEDAKLEASFKFKIDASQIKEWRKLGDNVEARMCRLDSYEPHQSWPSSLVFKVNGKDCFEIKEPKPGHKRRDLPHRISANLKPGVNSFEVILKDENVQRYALAIVRTSPTIPRDMCKRVPFIGVEDSKQRIKDLMFSSMLEGCVEEFQASSASDRSRLICPIALARIQTPARGKKCRHLQCFDLEAYLVSNQRMAVINKRWHCPICDLVIKPPGDLFIDTYVLQILAETGELDEEVAFDSTASWTVSAVAEPMSPDSEAEAGGPGEPSASHPAVSMTCEDDESSDGCVVCAKIDDVDAMDANDGEDDADVANADDNDVDDADEQRQRCGSADADENNGDGEAAVEKDGDDQPNAPTTDPPMGSPSVSPKDPSASPNWGSGSPDVDVGSDGEQDLAVDDPYCTETDPYMMAEKEDDEVDEDFVATLNDSPTEGSPTEGEKSSRSNGHVLTRAMSMSMIATPAPLASPMPGSPGDASDTDDPLGVDKEDA